MPFEIVFASLPAMSSISIGTTNRLFPPSFIFATSGTPIAIIGSPKLLYVNIFLELPTPLPGVSPTFVICMLLPTLAMSFVASESIAITMLGFTIFFADIIKPYKQGRGGYLYGIESAASGMPGGFFKYYEAVNGIV